MARETQNEIKIALAIRCIISDRWFSGLPVVITICLPKSESIVEF
jgi:hypothetical protein